MPVIVIGDIHMSAEYVCRIKYAETVDQVLLNEDLTNHGTCEDASRVLAFYERRISPQCDSDTGLFLAILRIKSFPHCCLSTRNPAHLRELFHFFDLTDV